MRGAGIYLTAISLIVLFMVYSLSYGAATTETTTATDDGGFVFTQKISDASTPPHYAPHAGYGFSVYSWFDEDYGWQHSFPLWDEETVKITSATLVIRSWDVDAETARGPDGEYDGVHADGRRLDPGMLQGTDNTWSQTRFNLPLSIITDDGRINIHLDIDMNHRNRKWAAALDYSLLTISYIETANLAPYQPELSIFPLNRVGDDDDLVVSIIGPAQSDPDNDPVDYSYRWYVDVGQGFYVDDEFAGKADHQGSTVPASQTRPGEKWKVEVCPKDNNRIIGQPATALWDVIGH